jgi:hypothetical protein
MKLPKSKRLRFSIAVIIANFIIGFFGIIKGADLTALGTFLALSNTPLYAYILGDSFRPSNLKNIDE